MLKTTPAVFAVGDQYQIMVEVEKESMMSVIVGNKTYYDASNGIMNSLSPIHRVSVPIPQLDSARHYTVCITPIIKRKPYYTEVESVQEFSFEFRPVPDKEIRIYHISDAHNNTCLPTKAARAFGTIDLLVLNGDIIDHCDAPENFSNIFKICEALTNGNIPVISSRGNHDMRGNFAEKFAEYTPNCNGNTYYTFRLGKLWGIVLDCGEDKDDSHIVYGSTVACHDFRQRQTEFLKEIIKNAREEYEAPGITTRLVISHNPFTHQLGEPFNIESDIYAEWASLLSACVKPHLMLCGHTHECKLINVGEPGDHLGQPCTLLIGSVLEDDVFTGAGLSITDDKISIAFTNSNSQISAEQEILK